MDYFEELEKKLRARIGSLPPEKIVFVGVGNRLQGDDAIGPLVIDLLRDRVPNAIDAGQTPEDITGLVRRVMPKAVIFVDVLFMKDMPPGAPAMAETGEIQCHERSARRIPIDAVMEYLKKETHADIFMIGVQPVRIVEGEQLSPGIEESVKKLASVLIDLLNPGKEPD